MAQFTFDLVSPERLVFSGEVTEVVVPGSEGDFGVMAGHAPVVSSLRPGILTIRGAAEGTKQVYVRGGFAEISTKGLTVLAEKATDLAQVDAATVEAEISAAETALAVAKDETAKLRLQERINQLKSVLLSLSAAKAH